MITYYNKKKFVDVLRKVMSKSKDILKKVPEWYELKKIIFIGKNKHHKEDEFFHLCFWNGLDNEWWEWKIKDYIVDLLIELNTKYKINNTKLVEFIFEFAKNNKLYYYRGNWDNIKLKESNWKYQL